MITAGDTKASVAENVADPVGVAYAAYPEVSNTLCAPATCTWSLSGTDVGDFNIGNQTDGTPGVLTFKAAGGPNYEMPADANGDNVYMVTVVVTDAGKGKLSAERDVVVTVTNVDEMGTVTLSSVQPKMGIALTATLTDPDGVVADSVKWTWHNVAATSVEDATNGNAISMATSDTYTPKMSDLAEAPGTLSAKASYTDGEGAAKMAVVSATVIANIANVAPKFPAAETGMREVAENTMTGMDFGDPVVAGDAN